MSCNVLIVFSTDLPLILHVMKNIVQINQVDTFMHIKVRSRLYRAYYTAAIMPVKNKLPKIK